MSEYEILKFIVSDEPRWAASDVIHRRDKSGLVRCGRYYKLAKNVTTISIRIHKYIVLLNYNEFLYINPISTFY